MPTDEEIRAFSEFSGKNLIPLVCERIPSNRMEELLKLMKDKVPGMTHIYGLTKHYPVGIEDLIYVVVSQPQIDLLCQTIAKTANTNDPRKATGYQNIYIGVQQTVDQRLSEITNPSTVVYGMF